MLLPPLPSDYLERLHTLEAAYLSQTDPLKQSGFGGDFTSWQKKRGIVLDTINQDGTFLDVGCANGYLLECLMRWANERGITLIPYGVDVGPRLIRLAQHRLPHWADHFFVGNIWDWEPPRRFHFVSTSLCVPEAYKPLLFQKLITQVVEPGGRLILRCYYKTAVTGSQLDYFDTYFDHRRFLCEQGLRPVGSVTSDPPGAEYVWIDC
ncbi:MAG: class I SAM-dependent methyltransferase [Chloroflexota bacterium]|nr:class I SAM-dependent methyltransferase [Chloroflexota bacterium]